LYGKNDERKVVEQVGLVASVSDVACIFLCSVLAAAAAAAGVSE